MARIFFFTGFLRFALAAGQTARLLAAKENLTIKEFHGVGNAKGRQAHPKQQLAGEREKS
jgi:hypothetical protein